MAIYLEVNCGSSSLFPRDVKHMDGHLRELEKREGGNSGWKFCAPSVRIKRKLCDSAVPEFGKFKRMFSTSFYWGFVSIIG